MLSVKRILLLAGLALICQTGFGFHIVGGEIEFETLEGGLYRINLIQYRDEAQTDNQVYEETITVYIFSNRTGATVSTHLLRLATITDVAYSNQECAIDELQTSRVLYTADIALNPENYSHEEGYYIVWERCCRNTVIKNINNPKQTGMKYVLEIPPLWKDNKLFINTSPSLLRPLRDYACVGQFYYTDFTGIDIDGDSLSYRLAAPLNSSSETEVPIPQPKPHIPVSWSAGYSVSNMVPGTKPLAISDEGLLTVNPNQTGIFVFSVIVEEWRDGVQIGELQRDFQMLVVDGCNPPDPPVVNVRIPDNSDFDPEVDILSYELAEEKCFDFIVTNVSAGETISLRAKGVNFNSDLEDVFSIEQSLIGDNQDSLLVEVCMPGCPPVRNGPFIIDLIAADDACPVPQLDTARLKVNVQPPPNAFPEFESVIVETHVLNSGERIDLELQSTDENDDIIDLELVVKGESDPAKRGLFLSILKQENGLTEGHLVWDTDCHDYDFSDRQIFEVGVYAEDLDVCEVPSPTVKWFNFELILPPNTSPVVSIDSDDSVAISVGNRLEIDVSAFDADNDSLNLILKGVGFDSETLGVNFENKVGRTSLESVFSWDIDCAKLGIQESTTYEFVISSEDVDECQVINVDQLTLKVHVDIPKNNIPIFEDYADATLPINQLYELDISAFDQDLDSITLEFFNPARLPKSGQIGFESATGYQQVTSTFRWTPDCSLLDFGESSAFYEIEFIAYDNSCSIAKFDTMSIVFEVVETREEFYAFEPPNAFTPNNDGKNDVYTLTNLTRRNQNLPTDNCDDSFVSISIHDRSGVNVFHSTSREFVWDGKNAPVGVYYYAITYTNTIYKGYIQLLR